MRKTFRLSSATAPRRHLCTAFLTIGLLAALFVSSAQADNGTWAQSTSGLFWSSPANWLNNTVADGATFTADFSTVDITAPTTVNLDSSRTIGGLKFQDATNANNDWTLSNNGVAGNVLTLANGANQPIINVLNRTATISAVLAGTNGFVATGGNSTLALSGANTFSGVTTLHTSSGTGNQFTLLLSDNSALGSSSVFVDPGSANNARILLNSGVNVSNNITLNTYRTLAGGNGALQTNGDVNATFSGTITINAGDVSGGTFAGPQEGAFNPAGNYLTFSGPIKLTLPSGPKSIGGGNALVARAGNIRLADTTGTSSYFRIEERSGALQVGATNGIATNAYVDVGGNVGNPQGYSVLDLNGFNQTLVGITNYVANGSAASVTNSSTTTPAVLTLAPANPVSNPNQANLVYTSGANGTGTNAVISDSSASAPLSLVVNGDAAGVQYLTTPADSYRGSTTLTSGTLAISSLANGGANSSIGASSNAAGNLVFNGGTLRYVNNGLNSSNAVVALANSTTPSTDRNFTIVAGSTGTLDVESAGTTLTISGGSTATTGTLIKAGLGTLVLTGANQHTGGTTINGGTLLVNSPGTLAAGAVTVNSGTTLGGNGTIGGTVSIASGGAVAPGNLGIGTMSAGALTLNTGGFVNFEFGATNDQITITNPGGLTVNGGNFNLFNAGTVTAFSTNGMYTLLNTTGAIAGALSNLTVSNPAAGKLYTLASTASAVQLTIGDATTREWNNGAGTGIWTTGGNWVGGIAPNSVGESAKFGNLSGGDVDLSGSKTVSGLIFDGSSYNLKGTASTLTLNNGVAASAIIVNNGSHSIAVPISLSNASSVVFTNNSSLAISGAISGGRPITVGGAGTLTLTGNNAYSTTAISAGATLNVGTAGGNDTSGTLGTGNATLSGAATLNFNRSNPYSFAGGVTGAGVGAGSVNQLGSGATTIVGAVSNITTVNVSAGSLVTSSTVGQTGGVNVTGAGSMTAAGGISGAGALNVNSTGAVALNADNSYTGGTAIAGGTVTLGSAHALPANSSLAVSGGTLDLHGNNISLSNIIDGVAGGVITNNAAASTSTITFGGSAASYDLFAALNDGAGGGKVALVTSIANSQSGNIYILHSHSTGTYSGGTVVNSQSIQADANNAFGTGPIAISANNASTNSSQIYVAPGVSIANNITIAQGNPVQVNITAAEGVIQQSAVGGNATVSGTITIQANNVNGGLFNGPLVGGPDFLNVTGAVNTSGTADTIIQIGGNVRYSGGGSYPNIQITGLGMLGAANGLSQSAVIQIGNAGGGTFDLGGFDQAAAGLATVNANSAIVQNTSAGTNTLTLNTTANNTFAGSITGNVNLTIAGTGTQRLTGTNSSYTGITKIGGTAVLEAANLSNGLIPSSIGAATNAPTNLVFDGGTLRYTGLDTTVDRGFTITAGKNATIEVTNATTNLTWSGGAASSSGGFTKTGPGTIIFPSGTVHGYTGPTAVNAGTLVVNNSLTNTTAVSVASGAVLTGNGTIGGTFSHTAGTVNPGTVGTLGTLSFSGPVTLNGGTFQFDVDGSNLAGTQDLAKANGGLSIAGPSTIDLEFQSLASVPTTPFDFTLFNYTGAAVTAAQAANLSFITNAASRATYSTNVGTAGKVIVHVVPGAAANLTWNSTSSGVWDVGTTANWLNGTTHAADKFANGDSVTFADGAGLQTNITLNTIASISGANVTSSTNNYTISGTGKITGAGALTKSGSSTLTLKTNNDFSGGTTISGGTVNVGGNSSSGSLGSGQITNNATLIYSRTDGNAFTPVVIPNTISGTGNLTLSFGGAANMTGQISQASLTANGAGAVTLSNSINTTGNVTISSGAVIANTQAQMSIGGALTVNGSGLLNSNQPISVSNGVTVGGTASLTSTGGISGTGGITQSTTGTVTVGGSNSYDGATVINSGAFFPNDPSAFGTTNAATTVNAGGQIYTTQANINFGTEPVTINGTGTSTNGTPNNDGALRAGGATTSTFGATVNVASNSLIGLDGGATLSLAGEPALSGSNVTVSLTGGGTLSLGGSVNLGANGVLATGTSPVAFAPADSTTITVKNPLTGSGPMTITNTGASGQATIGTTVLTVDSPNYTGAINTASTATASGNVRIQTPLGLGSATVGTTINGSGTATFLVGTVQLAPTSGGMTVAEPFTLGARQGPGIDVPHLENIQGNNTLTGTITTGTGGTDYNIQSDSGLLTITSNLIVPDAVTGPRNLKLQGNGNGVYSGVIPNGTAATNPGIFSLIKNGTGTWTVSGVNTFTGPTVINAGTLQLGVANSISRTSLVTLNGGTLSTGGLNQDLTLGATPAMLNLTNNSVIDLGNGASTLKLANSSTQPWSGNLSIVHWNTGADHLIIGADNTGVSSSQLLEVSFATYAPGVAISATGEITPSSLTRVLKLGDFSMDGSVNANDITAAEALLTNGLSTFGSDNGLTATQVLSVLDVDHSGAVNNADLIGLLTTLRNGGGSVAPVPEPASVLLAAGGLICLAAWRVRRKQASI